MSYQGTVPQSPTVTPQLISSSTGDIILSKEKKKSHLGVIITVVIVLLAVIAGICMALYFSNNNKTEQSHALSLDEYREFADSLTENEANLLSVSNVIDKGLSGEINSYMFLIGSYADGNNEIDNSIDETKAAIPKMSEFLNTIIKSNVDDDIKRTANIIINNYDSYSSLISSILQKIQDFRTAFLDSNQNELNSIMTSYHFSSSTTDAINNYERYYQELRSKAEECMNNSTHPIQECIRSSDSYWIYRETMESDYQTVSDLLSKIIDDNQLEIIKNTNNDILSLRKLIEAEFWALKSE